ncbi:MAG: 3-methyladenine DNA glycosylase [Chthoniobacterales bacterium]
MTSLSQSEWLMRQAAHKERVRPWVEPRLQRMSLGERHPVDDFLFEYYSYRPSQLMRWHPGIGVSLERGKEFLLFKEYSVTAEGDVAVDPSKLSPSRIKGLRWSKNLLERMLERPPAFGCFGLHEWAMVYRTKEIRHASWPLRPEPDTIAAVLDDFGANCSHFDAFRFFTPAARPLNRLQPTHENRLDFEQSGCLHANMDLYKWAMKLQPFAPSELVADCFELAREIRLFDMRASPYDLRSLGIDPVCIETSEGRQEYESAQREFTRRATPLRQKIITLCEKLLSKVNPPK